MTITRPAPANSALRRTTGTLFILGALSFAVAATVLSSTFAWPDILREPAGIVLPAFAAGGTSLIWTWFATAWTYALLAVPDFPVWDLAGLLGSTLWALWLLALGVTLLRGPTRRPGSHFGPD